MHQSASLYCVFDQLQAEVAVVGAAIAADNPRLDTFKAMKALRGVSPPIYALGVLMRRRLMGQPPGYEPISNSDQQPSEADVIAGVLDGSMGIMVKVRRDAAQES